jgi:hypothetical protein
MEFDMGEAIRNVWNNMGQRFNNDTDKARKDGVEVLTKFGVLETSRQGQPKADQNALKGLEGVDTSVVPGGSEGKVAMNVVRDGKTVIEEVDIDTAAFIEGKKIEKRHNS